MKDKKYFTSDQLNELQIGLQEGLNVNFYNQPEYLAVQMREIRLGLEEKLPVQYYAKP